MFITSLCEAHWFSKIFAALTPLGDEMLADFKERIKSESEKSRRKQLWEMKFANNARFPEPGPSLLPALGPPPFLAPAPLVETCGSGAA